MICLAILLISTLIKGITGHGFVEDPILLIIAGCLEGIIVLTALTIYEVITGKDLL